MDRTATHIIDQFHENVEFLREAGYSDELIASRLGVDMVTFKKRMERRGNG